MTTTPIKVPSFHNTTKHLVELASSFPHTTSPHAYVATTPQGEVRAHDLIAHIYQMEGGDLQRFFAPEEKPVTGTPVNSRMIANAWKHLFDSDPNFFGMQEDPTIAADYLTYILLAKVQLAQDNYTTADAAWKPAVLHALNQTKRKLNHKPSGFLAQTHGKHAQLLHNANISLHSAITALK